MAQFSRRALLQAAGATTVAAQAPLSPNVLLVMTDQQRYDCLAANGNGIIKTPNLDRLAAQSASFSRTFVQAPVCVPSRVSYFTSRYPHSHKNRVNYTPCDRSEVFLQKRFQEAGYQTGSVGKLHYYPPTRAHARTTGFDHVELDDGVAATEPYSDYVRWRKENDPQPAVPANATVKNPGPGENPYRGVIEAQYTQTGWVGLKTREMIRRFAESSRPFFLFSSFFKPHSPFTVPEPWASMYNGAEIPLPEPETLESIRKLPLPLQKLILRGKPAYGLDRAQLQWMYRSYYAAISHIDHEVGLMLDELQRSGLDQNTIVVFCSDHGAQLLEHGLTDKNVFFEGSIRVPMMVRYPRVVAPARYEEMIEAIDLMPSLLELCRIREPYNVQGRSFAPLIAGRRDAYRPRTHVFSENVIPEVITTGSLNMYYEPGEGIAGIRHPDAKMVRTDRWKLTHYPGHGGELYDLANDPREARNLYGDPTHRATVNELKGVLLDWMITADEKDQIARRWLV
jgi:arylsulfatase